MSTLKINPGVLAEPAHQAVDQIVSLHSWALRRPNDDQVAMGILAAIRWLTGRRGVGPMTDRLTPTCIDHVRAEYAIALGVSGNRGSTSMRASGAALVLAFATGDLGRVPALLQTMPQPPMDFSITYPCAA